MSDLRKWEDLEFNCLVNIIGRVGIESLLLDVPLVCKSWHKASFDPSCWERIDIPAASGFSRRGRLPLTFKRFMDRFVAEYQIEKFSYSRFMSLIISRGFSKSTFLDLTATSGCTLSEKFLQHLAERCHQLKSVSFGYNSNENVPKFIAKCEQLKEVRLEATMANEVFDEILAQIALNCKNFKSLIVRKGSFREAQALSIAKHLPKLKKLRIRGCYLHQEHLEIILRSCRELKYLDVSKSGYVGGWDWDTEKLKQLASKIKKAKVNAYRCYGSFWSSDFESVSSESGPESNGGSDPDVPDSDYFYGDCSYYKDDGGSGIVFERILMLMR